MRKVKYGAARTSDNRVLKRNLRNIAWSPPPPPRPWLITDAKDCNVSSRRAAADESRTRDPALGNNKTLQTLRTINAENYSDPKKDVAGCGITTAGSIKTRKSSHRR